MVLKARDLVKRVCPDCGAVHYCPVPETEAPTEAAPAGGKDRGGKGYSLYYVPCRCGCGCGHTCDLIYGPYAKVFNARGEAALAGPLGAELKQMRAASAQIRRDHLTAIHGPRHLNPGCPGPGPRA